MSSATRCQRGDAVCFWSVDGRGRSAALAGHGENADVGIVDQQGLELPSLATSNAKMARKPHAAAQASQVGVRLRAPLVSRSDQETGEGVARAGRDARSWDLCRRQSRNSLIETSYPDLVTIPLDFCFR